MLTGRAVIYKKDTAEDCRRLSIFDLNRQGLLSMLKGKKLEPGPFIEAHFNLKTPIQQRIHLESTHCYFGGVRWWLVCPGCGRRSGVLYLAPYRHEYRCLKCSKLSYTARQYHRDRMESLWRLLSGSIRKEQIIRGIGQKGPSKLELQQLRRLGVRLEVPTRDFLQKDTCGYWKRYGRKTSAC